MVKWCRMDIDQLLSRETQEKKEKQKIKIKRCANKNCFCTKKKKTSYNRVKVVY